MSPESARTNMDETPDTFVWEFNLNEIDPSLIFDESVEDPPIVEKTTEIAQQIETAPSFSEWLTHTVPVVEEPSKKVPTAFKWAQQEAVKTSERLSTVSLIGLSSIGGALNSLMSVVGACGPLCFHTLSAVASASSSGISLASPGTGGFNSTGFNVDRNGNFKLSGNIHSLSSATGLSKEALLSGKYSAQDILTTFLSVFGEGMYHICCFGLIECLMNTLIPTPDTVGA